MFEDMQHQQAEADQGNQGHSEEEERLVRERWSFRHAKQKSKREQGKQGDRERRSSDGAHISPLLPVQDDALATWDSQRTQAEYHGNIIDAGANDDTDSDVSVCSADGYRRRDIIWDIGSHSAQETQEPDRQTQYLAQDLQTAGKPARGSNDHG
jgi:hypothetical protein